MKSLYQEQAINNWEEKRIVDPALFELFCNVRDLIEPLERLMVDKFLPHWEKILPLVDENGVWNTSSTSIKCGIIRNSKDDHEVSIGNPDTNQVITFRIWIESPLKEPVRVIGVNRLDMRMLLWVETICKHLADDF